MQTTTPTETPTKRPRRTGRLLMQHETLNAQGQRLSLHRTAQHGWASPDAYVQSILARRGGSHLRHYGNGLEETRTVAGAPGYEAFECRERVTFVDAEEEHSA